MIPARRDPDVVIYDFVDEAMLPRDAPRPITLESVFEQFWFTDPDVAATVNVSKQIVEDGVKRLRVVLATSAVWRRSTLTSSRTD